MYVNIRELLYLSYCRQQEEKGVGYVVGRPMRHTISPGDSHSQSHSRGTSRRRMCGSSRISMTTVSGAPTLGLFPEHVSQPLSLFVPL